jgi:hypothetical protein
MSSTVNILTNITLANDSAIDIGDSQVPVVATITNGSVFHVENLTIGTGIAGSDYIAKVLWAAPAAFPDYQWGVIFSTQDLLIQFKNSLGTPEYSVGEVKANVPYYFGYLSRGKPTTTVLATGVQTTGLGNCVEIMLQNNTLGTAGLSALVDFYLFR